MKVIQLFIKRSLTEHLKVPQLVGLPARPSSSFAAQQNLVFKVRLLHDSDLFFDPLVVSLSLANQLVCHLLSELLGPLFELVFDCQFELQHVLADLDLGQAVLVFVIFGL